MSKPWPSSIAIIGAGLGGLMFARSLQHLGSQSDIHVYERDESADSRSQQGGTLDLHRESGLEALGRAGLMEEFDEARMGAAGEETRVLSKDGVCLVDDAGPPSDGGRPEIDRHKLRTLLLKAVKDGTVRWAHTLQSAEKEDDGVLLTFKNGSKVTADLVVGADGAFSQIRRLVSLEDAGYAGYTHIEVTILQAKEKHTSIVGPGSAFAIGDGKALISQRNSDGRIRTYACLPVPEAWKETPSSLAETAALYAGWSPDLLALISDADTLAVRRRYTLPPGHMWRHDLHVTLLGDAAHLLLPTGEGANLALLDGADLADAIMASDKDSISRYEERMCQRAETAARESVQTMRVLTDPVGPQAFLDMLASFGPPPVNEPMDEARPS